MSGFQFYQENSKVMMTGGRSIAMSEPHTGQPNAYQWAGSQCQGTQQG